VSPPPDPLRTERLLLRPWRASDLDAFAALNADPRVMELFPAVLSRAESEEIAVRVRRAFEENGYGLWAIEVPGVADFIGFTGLSRPRFEAHFTPCVEIGWRLAFAHWGQGYATEASRAALHFGFASAKLEEIVSMTVPANRRSIAVMEKLGMRRDPADDFDHPRIPEGHPLRRHVLYRLRNAESAAPVRPGV
jgi:RimJ/RimL family protein N-acetyltransferase